MNGLLGFLKTDKMNYAGYCLQTADSCEKMGVGGRGPVATGVCYELRSYKSSISWACGAFDVTAAARRSPLSPYDSPDFALLGKMQRLQGPASFAAGLPCANSEKSAHVLPPRI
jgi:hypothetical protein